MKQRLSQRYYLVLIPLFALALLVGCSSSTPTDTEGDATAKDSPSAMTDYKGSMLSGKHTVILHTSKGDVTIELDADAAPKTVTNFIELAKKGYYDDLTFHRVIPDFMIQGGDPNGEGTGGKSIYGDMFEDEINADSYDLGDRMLKDEVSPDEELPAELKDKTVKDYYEMIGYEYNDDLDSLPMEYGYVAMANRGPNTNGSQFFIIQRKEGTDWLEGKHTVFGKVTDGMDIVDTIAKVARSANDKPIEPVTFTVEVTE